MPLTVPISMQAEVANDELGQEDFIACVRDFLAYAFGLLAALAEDLSAADREFADNLVPPPDEPARGELLRGNRQRLDPGRVGAALRGQAGVPELRPARCLPAGRRRRRVYAEFISPGAQLLNQSPELVDC